jgi:hypothetical protein
LPSFGGKGGGASILPTAKEYRLEAGILELAQQTNELYVKTALIELGIKASGDEELRIRLRELASQRRRFGYRRLGLMLKRQGVKLHHKRLYRLGCVARYDTAQCRFSPSGLQKPTAYSSERRYDRR